MPTSKRLKMLLSTATPIMLYHWRDCWYYPLRDELIIRKAIHQFRLHDRHQRNFRLGLARVYVATATRHGAYRRGFRVAHGLSDEENRFIHALKVASMMQEINRRTPVSIM